MNPYKKDFPILHDESFSYLDSAATAQKPHSVIEAVDRYYREENANPHRGAYNLSVRSTNIYEGARKKAADFIGALEPEQIIFTKNSTEAFNLLAYCYGREFLKEGDEILITVAEHHSNLVPWQQVAKKTGAKLVYVYTDENGKIPEIEWKKKITSRTKIVSVFHVSNVLGTENPVEWIGKKAHEAGAIFIVDAAQSIPHMRVDVKKIDADFLVFSGHKMMGAMGIGVLYGKKEILENMPPFLYGGDMIEYVREQDSAFAPLPGKFEAGTQDVAAAAGLSAAIDYLEAVGYPQIQKVEKELIAYAMKCLLEKPYVSIHGSQRPEDHKGVISFSVEGIHPHDIASILDAENVAIRSGHHCAHPLMSYMGVKATCRISLYIYNEKTDIDRLIAGLKKAREYLGYGSA